MDQHSILFQAMVFLAAAIIFVPIAKKLGLGSVLGYLIAGVIIGPFVLEILTDEGQDLMHYAEFGVVMMLFLIGLELEPQLLWKLRKTILGLGGLQVVISSIAIAGLSMLLGFNWKESLILGMILSLSSTAIVLQTLNEKGLMKTSAGQSSFAVLLFQDIAVIPMLALFPLFATISVQNNVADGHSTVWVKNFPGWLQGFIVLGAVVLIIVAGRLVVRPVLRIVAKTGMRELFTASALLIVVGIAVLMAQVGLSAALGAFLGGVVLANSEFRHELESDIEPFKGLLLGLFFLTVGASIDFNLFAQRPLEILGWVGALIIVKTAVLFFLGRSFKLAAEQNLVFAFSLSQVGEFAFVLLSLSLKEGILPADTINLMIAVVAISMALTPLVFMLNEKLLLPRIGTEEKPEREADLIDEKNPVIIAGFGHFGNTVGRFLRANKINATYLDIDSDRVDVLRRMGFKVFYGDASRYDLLESAGAHDARIIIIAIEPAEKRLEMVEMVKKHFPHLHMLVRSTNRFDAYNQMNAGILHIYRETLDTSLRVGVDAMTILGHRHYTAKRLARLFMKHDEENLKKLSAVRDQEEHIVEAKKYIEELELIIQQDTVGTVTGDAGWDPESIRAEVQAAEKQ
jgi:monovalent cation:H+ antiporter-2, CPA2 family